MFSLDEDSWKRHTGGTYTFAQTSIFQTTLTGKFLDTCDLSLPPSICYVYFFPVLSEPADRTAFECVVSTVTRIFSKTLCEKTTQPFEIVCNKKGLGFSQKGFDVQVQRNQCGKAQCVKGFENNSALQQTAKGDMVSSQYALNHLFWVTCESQCY